MVIAKIGVPKTNEGVGIQNVWDRRGVRQGCERFRER